MGVLCSGVGRGQGLIGFFNGVCFSVTQENRCNMCKAEFSSRRMFDGQTARRLSD